MSIDGWMDKEKCDIYICVYTHTHKNGVPLNHLKKRWSLSLRLATEDPGVAMGRRPARWWVLLLVFSLPGSERESHLTVKSNSGVGSPWCGFSVLGTDSAYSLRHSGSLEIFPHFVVVVDWPNFVYNGPSIGVQAMSTLYPALWTWKFASLVYSRGLCVPFPSYFQATCGVGASDAKGSPGKVVSAASAPSALQGAPGALHMVWRQT